MSTVRRGTLLSFDAGTWTAFVLLDGADTEAQMPVGVWVQSQMMVADLEVAVLVFGGTNTDDGIVLGPYGVLGLQDLHPTADPTFDSLNLGAASGAGSGELRATETDSGTANQTDSLILDHDSSGTPTTNFGLNVRTRLQSSTTPAQEAALDQVIWATATHASRKARRFWYVYDTAAREVLRGEASGTAPMIGFLGAAAVARASAYTQTYATTTRTHANVTAVDPAAYAAGANGYSTAAIAQAVHAEVIALRADLVVVKNLLNSLIDDLQALGLVG